MVGSFGLRCYCGGIEWLVFWGEDLFGWLGIVLVLGKSRSRFGFLGLDGGSSGESWGLFYLLLGFWEGF